jgi:hydrogenase maturation factor
MVMAVKKDGAVNVIQRLKQSGIQATAIGSFTDKEQGYKLAEQGIISELPYYSEDPYWAAFFNALNKGWK